MYYSVKYPSFYSEAPEKTLYYSVCRSKDCGWEEENTHEYRDDCHVSVCPDCGSEDISDKSESA